MTTIKIEAPAASPSGGKVYHANLSSGHGPCLQVIHAFRNICKVQGRPEEIPYYRALCKKTTSSLWDVQKFESLSSNDMKALAAPSWPVLLNRSFKMKVTSVKVPSV